MFRKAFTSTLFLLLLALLSILYYCFYVLPKDVKNYEDYIEKTIKKPSQKHTSSSTQQFRKHVQKDIWHREHEEPVHYQIKAETSILSLTSSAQGLLMQESMHTIQCLLQEKLYENALHQKMQQLKAFYADDGLYHFNKHHFEAKRVFLNFYALPGHTLPKTLSSETAFLQGVAKAVSLTLSEQGADFHAETFKASMHSLEFSP
jgi:hypothetical protein